MNEKIKIDEKALQYGVLFKDGGYQMYTYPGMTVAEVAFCIMVTTRILLQDGYIKNAEELLDLVYKYLNDVQYKPLEVTENDS